MFAFFEKLIKPFPPEEPEQPPKNLIAFCWHYTRGMQLHLIVMALLAAAIAVMEVSLFAFLGQLVDWLSTHSPETLFEEEGTRLLWWSLLVVVGLPLAVLLHSMVVHQGLLGNYPMLVRWQSHRYLLGQSLSFYQDEFAGRVATKVMQTSQSVRETVLKLLGVLMHIAVYFTGVVVVAANLDLRLTVPLLVWAVLYIGILVYCIPRLERCASRQADARSRLSGLLVDTYTNMATVKLFSHSRREADYAREGMSSFLNVVYPQMRLVTVLVVSVWFVNTLLIFGEAALSVGLWMQGAITAGAIAAAVGAVLRLYGMSQSIMWETAALLENIGTVQDGMRMLSRERDVVDVPEAEPLKLTRGEIAYENVSFNYGKGRGLIDNFSLNIQPGEKVGFVGRSGAGKSTLATLLLRFHDLEGGRILIDGQDIARVKQESLRAQIGMVTQDTSLLHRTVRENILYGRPDASEHEMLRAARKAHADEFIHELSDVHGRSGYDAEVGERGVKLSGGQRQRIAIARVLLKDAPILILDEATSALDSEVEAAIQESLYTLMEGKTVIAIAHRLSTIAALDRLVVLDQGRIVEQGTHSQLVARRGLYAQLWAHQSGGFLGEETVEEETGEMPEVVAA